MAATEPFVTVRPQAEPSPLAARLLILAYARLLPPRTRAVRPTARTDPRAARVSGEQSR